MSNLPRRVNIHGVSSGRIIDSSLAGFLARFNTFMSRPNLDLAGSHLASCRCHNPHTGRRGARFIGPSSGGRKIPRLGQLIKQTRTISNKIKANQQNSGRKSNKPKTLIYLLCASRCLVKSKRPTLAFHLELRQEPCVNILAKTVLRSALHIIDARKVVVDAP